MKAHLASALILVLVVPTLPLLAAEEPPRDLNKIEAALKNSPDDPMLHYRKCQALYAQGREQEAVDHAAMALQKFKVAGSNLAWLGLGTINTNQYRIEVHYNMGPGERADEKDREGIVRPLSFRVWTTNAPPRLVRTLSFELAYLDGKVISAAIGEEIGSGHANFGIVDPMIPFASLKRKVLEILIK